MKSRLIITAVASVLATLSMTVRAEGQSESRVTSTSSSALNLTETFFPNTVTISSSEGAPYGDCDFWTEKAANCFNETNLGYGPTKVVRIYICLSGEVSISECSQQPEVTGPLSPAMLTDIESRVAAFAGSGIRLIPRFTYNFGPIGPGAMDAPSDVIAKHIDQLAPILIRHKDLIFALEAGFIGTWGEWHDSTNGNDTAAAQKIVLNRELAHFKGLFPILVRYPGDFIQYTDGLNLHPGLGLHDDFYASDSDDGATWNTCDPGAGYCLTNFTLQQFVTLASRVSVATMFAGEFGALYPTLQSCDALNGYSYKFHVQSISLNPFPATIGTFLQNEGCALSFYNKVGTRIVLQRVKLTGDATPGGKLCLEIMLVNDGYGRVIRERPLAVVLRQSGKDVATIPIPTAMLDLRTLESSPTQVPKTFHFEFTLPKTIATGTTTMTLLFPDPAPTLTNQPAYTLPLNSVDQQGMPVFEPMTGHNRIITFDIN
jgi:hypothetical protein